MDGAGKIQSGVLAFLAVLGTFGFQTAAVAQADYTEEFLSPPGAYPANHSATLAELPGKKLMACWYAGAYEGASDTQIYCRTQNLGSPIWNEDLTVAVARHEATHGNFLFNDTIGNPVLYRDDDDRLYLFYAVRMFGGWTLSELAFKVSEDLGKTWSHGKILDTLFSRRWGGRLPRALPIRIDRGQILLPLYYDLVPRAGYTCLIDLISATKKEVRKVKCMNIPGNGHLQPTLVEVGGRVFAYLRSSNDAHKIESASIDFQVHQMLDPAGWTKEPDLELDNPNSSVAATSTSDGRVLLVYNSVLGGRNILSLAISTDGKKFEHVFDFDKRPESSWEFSYPTIFRDSNGVFQLVYTWGGRAAIKHVSFTEAWLNQQKPIN
jgi:alpha-L-fucosidase